MGIKFEFFEAGCGDSILVSTDDGTHILIDGGVGSLYTRKLRKLNKTISNSKLDLMILTHLDNDHILGLRNLLAFDIENIVKNNEYIPFIKEVWYNAFRNTSNTNDIEFKNPSKNSTICIKNQLKFTEYMDLSKNKIRYRDYISIDDIDKPLEINEIELILLSPNDEKLRDLYLKYEKELSDKNISSVSKCKDIKESIEYLYGKEFKDGDDGSVANGSSIAFILLYKKKKFLFLADAHIPLVTKSLKKIQKQYFPNEKRMAFEFIKVSHHGSRNNISTTFLDLVSSQNYVILTNTKGKNRHPDKETLSKILVHNKKLNYAHKINFIFNYSAGAKDSRYDFSKEDKKEYNFELIHSNFYPFRVNNV